jgi:hypothetical protein
LKPSLRIISIAGATATALSLVAAPAFAAPQMISTAGASVSTTAAAPIVSITPAHISAHKYATTGITAHLRGFPAKTVVTFGLAAGQSGGGIAEDKVFTTTSAGTLNFHYKPGSSAGIGTYTFTAFYTPAASTTTTTSTTGTTDPAPTTESVPVRSTYVVKPSDAKVAWGAAHRSGTAIALKATVTRWSATAKKYVPWHSATVKFQERIAGAWKTKTTVTTDSKGVAAKTVSAKVHTWRALVVTTKTTWGISTKAHKK